MRTSLASLVLLGSGLLCACGESGPTGAEPIADRVRWRPDDEPAPQVAAWDRWFGPIRWAQSPAAGVEPPTPFVVRPAIGVALWSGDELYMLGKTWPMSRPEWATWFQSEIRSVRYRVRDLPVQLFVDVGRTWGDVARVVDLAREEPPGVPLRVRFHVSNPDVIAGLLELRLASGAPGGPPPPADLTLDVLDRARAVHPRVRLLERMWEFPAGNPYARGPSLDAANAAWVEIHAALAAAVPPVPDAAAAPPVLGMAIDPRAPWPHTVQLLALAHLAGWRRLRIDSLAAGAQIEVSSPPDPPLVRRWRVGLHSDPLAPEPSDPRDLTPFSAALLATALAAAVVFLPPLLDRLLRRPRLAGGRGYR